VSLFHCHCVPVSVSPCHCVTVPLCHSLCHRVVSLCHRAIVSPRHCVTASLCHRIIVSLCHCQFRKHKYGVIFVEYSQDMYIYKCAVHSSTQYSFQIFFSATNMYRVPLQVRQETRAGLHLRRSLTEVNIQVFQEGFTILRKYVP